MDHNRLRMLTRMFLTNNLLIDWKQGTLVHQHLMTRPASQ